MLNIISLFQIMSFSAAVPFLNLPILIGGGTTIAGAMITLIAHFVRRLVHPHNH